MMLLLHEARDRAFRRFMTLSDRWIGRAVGAPVELDGQTLDVQTQAMLAAAKVAGVKDLDAVAEARAAMDRDVQAVAPAAVAMKRERDFSMSVGGVSLPARLYVPKTAPALPPLLVFFHGGGWVCGSLRSHDAGVRELAHESGIAILAVEYRLAPEHKAPTAAEDGFLALKWARANAGSLGIDGARVGVGGDSAGGNVSAVVSHLCRERQEPQPWVQLLIYPAVDATCSSESHRTFSKGFFLEEARIQWYLRHYLTNGADHTAPHVSPIYAETFRDLAPAIVVTAGFDPLRDEGAAYAEKLRGAGGSVVYRCERSLIHGFFNMTGVVREARAAQLRIAEDVRRAFARS